MQSNDNPANEFTPQDVEIISKKTLFRGFFKMVKYTFKHRLFEGGWSQPIEREMFERGHAAALVPYDPIRDEVVIIEQIRVGALEHENPWQLEIVAGIIDTDETAENVARREALEEAGLEVKKVLPITSYYPSSGGCSEKLDVFVGQVDSSLAKGVHGLDYEGEDIRVQVMKREQAYQYVKDGKFANGATIIAMQWLQLNYLDLQSQWKE
ncbi:ADP-ribose diphosphatase [Vibrio gallaecicus]|uniref:ADP-ribose diphosphatase n=1 Tax=Vibrio gallaecicus TaxID=552386 RepID=UPI0010C9B0F8|nr:ADP-ribose diphosphatase [Vibrio gallaecicus]MDN3615210.1 ADP-ribose diphosphatase [Vibrio gallaecicus]